MALNESQLTELADEVANDPESLGLSWDLEDLRLASALNAPRFSVRQRVPIPDMMAQIDRMGVWPKILMLADDDTADPVQRAAALQAIEFRRHSRYNDVDMDATAFGQAMQDLIDAGVFTTEQADSLDALADVLVSRSEVLFGARVHHLDVARARSLR